MVATEPKIVAFLCNWCSYAGADLAGMSRINYPPNIRPIRLMCSGRVNPSFILEAFERGADGVLVSGCHLGDCHYISGNLKAEKRVKTTWKLLELLGINPKRLRLEWISASEGERFAEIVQGFTNDLRRIGPNPIKYETEGEKPAERSLLWDYVKKTNVQYCIECGKCSSVCPIARINMDYSPRRTVERFLLGFEEKVLTGKELWMCSACYLCRERCPQDVKFPEFIRACRTEASRMGVETTCAHGGVLLSVSRLMTNLGLEQNRLGWLPEDAKVAEKGEVLYFTGCLPHLDAVFEDIGFEGQKIAQSAVRILNEAGIKPVVMKDEKCCGHDLLWSGDMENFEKLAKANVEAIKKTKATKVVTTCPECYRTLKVDYAEALGELGFEVVHMSELTSELINRNRLKPKKKLNVKVTYQDPCRLGRHMGVYDEPRNVISSLLGIEFLEMERNREAARCCGVSSWVNCNKYAKDMQIERLREAKSTGADHLITACPKCQIHFKCVMNEKLPVKPEEITMKVSDLTVLLAQAMDIM